MTAIKTAFQHNAEHVGEVNIKVVPIQTNGDSCNSSLQSVRPATSLTAAVLSERVREPFIGDYEQFHVERMGELAGHFVRLGHALERKEKSAADFAHALALAEDLAWLLNLQGVELRQDAAGVVRAANP